MQFIKETLWGFLFGEKGTNSWVLLVLIVFIVIVWFIFDRIKKVIRKKNKTNTNNMEQGNN